MNGVSGRLTKTAGKVELHPTTTVTKQKRIYKTEAEQQPPAPCFASVGKHREFLREVENSEERPALGSNHR